MIQTASEEIHARIRTARARIAAGVRLHQPSREALGRQEYAAAIIENQVLLFGHQLTDDARTNIARMLFEVPAPTPAIPVSSRDTQALKEIQSVHTPADIVPSVKVPIAYDPDNEVEEDEDD